MSEQDPGREPPANEPAPPPGGSQPPPTPGSTPQPPAPGSGPESPPTQSPATDTTPPQAGSGQAIPAEEQPSLPVPLQQGEQVLELCRRHWIHLWPSIALQVVLAIAPLIIAAFLLDLLGLEGTVATAVWIGLGVHAGYRVIRAFLTWYRYHNDIWLITNQRLIDSYKNHPFSLRVASADLVNVQDISIHREGILRTMLDYGDIVCQTAGQAQVFRLGGIPDPRTIQALIDRERDRERLRTR